MSGHCGHECETCDGDCSTIDSWGDYEECHACSGTGLQWCDECDEPDSPPEMVADYHARAPR